MTKIEHMWVAGGGDWILPLNWSGNFGFQLVVSALAQMCWLLAPKSCQLRPVAQSQCASCRAAARPAVVVAERGIADFLRSLGQWLTDGVITHRATNAGWNR